MELQTYKLGFTLVELMVVMAIAAILLSLAAPSFRNLLIASEVSTIVNEFTGSFELARSEAIMRAGLVTLCRSSNAETGDAAKCDWENAGSADSKDWSVGWIVYVENSTRERVGTREAGEVILLRKGMMRDGMRLTQTTARKTRDITFNGTGEPSNLNGTGFNFSNKGEFPLQICIARTGRLRLIKGAVDCG